MKYCTHCGKELLDEAVICPGCGCRVESAPSKSPLMDEDDKKIFALIIKVFMVIGCIASGWALIPLLWTIPMTKRVFNKLDNKEPMGVGFKVCVLLFVNVVAGIMLLVRDEMDEFRESL